ncbi:hypothetical protein CYG49_01605 [Candidatus Saccharibacteria bacterium]|nr:MAG: hypothetical protein CYG49_01605 [Candidatus Saccharibacteria bacterium]
MVTNMIKIMLVEDDKSLREIYGVRLLAEGYDIVSAGDGEEALAMAIKERPQLIISDVMMPKISGFDMLDILRSTTETKNIKVIMMTALSSEEQRNRGESLGADRYLVKSQVGIEDVVRVVHEVLGDQQPAPQQQPQTAQSDPKGQAPAQPTPTPQQSSVLNPAVAPVVSQPSLAQPPATPQVQQPQTLAAAQPAPVAPATESPKPPSIKTRIIQPISNPASAPVDFGELLDKELAKEAGVNENDIPTVATTEQEKALIDDQINQFAQTPAPAAPQPSDQGSDDTSSVDVPEISIGSDGNIQQNEPPAPAAAPVQAPSSNDEAIAEAILASAASQQQAPVADTSTSDSSPASPVQAPIIQDITGPSPAAQQATPQPAMPQPILPQTPTVSSEPTQITITQPSAEAQQTPAPVSAPEEFTLPPAPQPPTPPSFQQQSPPPLPPVPPRA